jgi:hypothetical protein
MKYYDKMYNKIISAGSQGYYYTWIDSANGQGLMSATLKLQRMAPDGNKAFGEEGISVTKDIPYQSVSDFIGDERNGLIIATAFKLFRYDSTGHKLPPDSGVYISRFIKPLTLNRKANSIICSSFQFRFSQYGDYYLTSIDPTGNIQWEKKILDSINADIELPKITINDNGDINLFWLKQFYSNDFQIYYLKVDKSGTFNFDSSKQIVTENTTILDVKTFVSDSNSNMVVWFYKSSLYAGHYRAMKVDSTGDRVWLQLVQINLSETDQGLIQAVSQNQKGVILVWYELIERNGIYAQNINSNGKLGPITQIEKDSYKDILHDLFQFVGNYPNPFNMGTQIVFRLPHRGEVKISIYDVLGREVSQHIQFYETEGLNSFRFNGNGLTSGVYLCSITYGGKRVVSKMQLVK